MIKQGGPTLRRPEISVAIASVLVGGRRSLVEDVADVRPVGPVLARPNWKTMAGRDHDVGAIRSSGNSGVVDVDVSRNNPWIGIGSGRTDEGEEGQKRRKEHLTVSDKGKAGSEL